MEKYKRSNEIMLISVSRLAKEKNLYFLLEALKYIKMHAEINFRCIIAGDGPERGGILRIIENSVLKDVVSLIGSVKQEEIGKYYLFSDIFVFASQSETQGMVLLEAMAGGCPVIAIRSSGVEDVIHNGSNGFKTEADIKIWSGKIIYLMKNLDVLKKMPENARSFSEGFSTEVMAAKASRVYVKVMRRQKQV